MHLWYFVDDTSCYPANSGIQRVTRCLASTLERQNVEMRYLCWDVPSKDFRPLTDPARIKHLSQFNGPQTCEKWAARADAAEIKDGWLINPELVTHTLKGNLGQVIDRAHARNMRTATIFYDAIPIKLTEFYDLKFRRLHAQYMGELMANDLVLAISDTSLADLNQHVMARWGLNATPRARRLRLDLPGELIGTPRVTAPSPGAGDSVKILCVGTVEPRKNHFRLVDAFQNLKRLYKRPVELVIVGATHQKEYGKRFAEFMADKAGVTWMRKISDEQLAQLYRDCTLTIYPSLEEGYGLPVMESLWNGKACICSGDGATGEIARGGGCLPVNTHSTDALTVAMLRLLEDRLELERLGREASERPIKRWEEYAREVLDVLK